MIIDYGNTLPEDVVRKIRELDRDYVPFLVDDYSPDMPLEVRLAILGFVFGERDTITTPSEIWIRDTFLKIAEKTKNWHALPEDALFAMEVESTGVFARLFFERFADSLDEDAVRKAVEFFLKSIRRSGKPLWYSHDVQRSGNMFKSLASLRRAGRVDEDCSDLFFRRMMEESDPAGEFLERVLFDHRETMAECPPSGRVVREMMIFLERQLAAKPEYPNHESRARKAILWNRLVPHAFPSDALATERLTAQFLPPPKMIFRNPLPVRAEFVDAMIEEAFENERHMRLLRILSDAFDAPDSRVFEQAASFADRIFAFCGTDDSPDDSSVVLARRVSVFAKLPFTTIPMLKEAFVSAAGKICDEYGIRHEPVRDCSRELATATAICSDTPRISEFKRSLSDSDIRVMMRLFAVLSSAPVFPPILPEAYFGGVDKERILSCLREAEHSEADELIFLAVASVRLATCVFFKDRREAEAADDSCSRMVDRLCRLEPTSVRTAFSPGFRAYVADRLVSILSDCDDAFEDAKFLFACGAEVFYGTNTFDDKGSNSERLLAESVHFAEETAADGRSGRIVAEAVLERISSGRASENEASKIVSSSFWPHVLLELGEEKVAAAMATAFEAFCEEDCFQPTI